MVDMLFLLVGAGAGLTVSALGDALADAKRLCDHECSTRADSDDAGGGVLWLGDGDSLAIGADLHRRGRLWGAAHPVGIGGPLLGRADPPHETARRRGRHGR